MVCWFVEWMVCRSNSLLNVLLIVGCYANSIKLVDGSFHSDFRRRVRDQTRSFSPPQRIFQRLFRVGRRGRRHVPSNQETRPEIDSLPVDYRAIHDAVSRPRGQLGRKGAKHRLAFDGVNSLKYKTYKTKESSFHQSRRCDRAKRHKH